MILSVTGARATHVSCLGFEDRHEDGIFRVGANLRDNTFSNETAPVRTSDGGMCRINEFRRVGWNSEKTPSVYMSMFGTLGSFEQNAVSSSWSALKREETADVTQHLSCKQIVPKHGNEELYRELQTDFYKGVSMAHPVKRLPEEYIGMDNGHEGSHQFLVDDFVQSVAAGKLPPNHAWAAAKYCAPGLVAHESALRGGSMLEIPDFGEPSANWQFLNPIDISE